MNTQNNNVIVMPTAADYIKEEVAEILSPFNKWVTGKDVGHNPSSCECFDHWRFGGGSFRIRPTFLSVVSVHLKFLPPTSSTTTLGLCRGEL